MSNVIVVALFQVKPGTEEEARAALTEVLEQTHGEEGCRTYALHVSRTDPTQLAIIERWDDQAALDAHFTQPYMAKLAESAGAVLAAPPVVHFMDAVPAGSPEKGTLAGA